MTALPAASRDSTSRRTPGRPTNRERARGSAAGQPDQGAGRHLGAGHGVRQARPGVLHPPGLAGLAGGLLPAGRPGGPGAGRRAGRAGAGRVGRADLGLLRHLRDSRRAAGRADPRRAGPRLGQPEPIARRTRGGDRDSAAAGWRACSRSWPSTTRCERRPAAGSRTGQPWYFDEPKWTALRKVRAAEADLMRAYAHGEGCLMQFLQLALDDPDPQPCGRCSVCTGRRCPPPAPARRVGDDVDAARPFFRGQDVVVEPRKLWAARIAGPQGQDPRSWRRAGRSAFADDPAWDGELAALWRQRRRRAARDPGRHGRGAEALVDDLGAAGRGGRPCRRGASRP